MSGFGCDVSRVPVTVSPQVAQARLHIVTGKGGVGKTTMAAALALHLAQQGKKVLVVEVEGRQGLAQVFDTDPLGAQEERVASGRNGGQVFGLAIDPHEALLEYVRRYAGMGMAVGFIKAIGVVDFAATIAPGARDVLLLGKIYEAVTRTKENAKGLRRESLTRREGRHDPQSGADYIYDAVVVDAPPIGRINRFLGIGADLAGLARFGPINHQSLSIHGLVISARTAVHVVTLLEDMPVQETVDAVPVLREQGLQLGLLMINRDQVPLPAQLQAGERLRQSSQKFVSSRIAADLQAAQSGLSAAETNTLAQGLAAVGNHQDAVWQAEQQARQELQDLGLPVVHMPVSRVGAAGIHQVDVRVLAQVFQEVWH